MKVHFIAIGGSAMHNLAIALHLKGLNVNGSDDEIFEPSKSRLEKHGLLPAAFGWYPEKITTDLDYVVLGMHARKDNPELLRAQELGLKILSYPEFLYEQSKDKTRVVIAGSHGKTTISAMVLHVLHYHRHECDFMIGAQLAGFENMVKLTEENEFILLEGDEYLSSPTDLRPKFLHYHPNIVLISGIAWDHVNVFPTFENYLKQFELLLEHIEPGGAVIYNGADPEVVRLVENTGNQVKKFRYGYPDYHLEQNQVFIDTDEGPLALQIFGKHNMLNLEGARWICNQMGINDPEFYEAISSFKGADRRLETVYNDHNIIAFRDFAHAPSKVKATVDAVKETYPNHHVLACFELHTFSSLNSDFITQYAGSLDHADTAMVYFNPNVVAHKKLPALNTDVIQKGFDNPSVKVFDKQAEIANAVREKLQNRPLVLLVMSSGTFDGIDWKKMISEQV